MNWGLFVIQFLIILAVSVGFVAWLLKRMFYVSIESTKKRLDEELAKTTAKQTELSRKIKEADEELSKRQAEAKELAAKMRLDAETETESERERIIKAARDEGEDIITKAQNATKKLKEELEREMDQKALKFSSEILTKVLSQKNRDEFYELLIKDFLSELKTVDMSRLSSDVKEIEVITLKELDSKVKEEINKIIKEKTSKEYNLKCNIDKEMGGGIILKFGSMAVDGSLREAIREVVVNMQNDLENKLI